MISKKATSNVEGAMLIGVLLLGIAIMIVLNPGVLKTSAVSGTNVIQANVVVPAFCQIASLSNTLVNFGALNPGTGAATGNLVVVYGTNQNTNGNVFIQGTNWLILGWALGGPSANFFAANTLWDHLSVPQGTGNPLNLYNGVNPGNYADTMITITPGGSNNIFFGTQFIPAGQAAGTYVQNVILENYCSGTGYSVNSNVMLTVNVPSLCFIQVSNTLIQFGSANPGSGAATGNTVYDTDTQGNINANIFVEGANWIVPGGIASQEFFAANTLWSNYPTGIGTSAGGNAVNFGGIPAAANFLDTKIAVVFGLTGNTINFGVTIPAAQVSGAYETNVIVENSC